MLTFRCRQGPEAMDPLHRFKAVGGKSIYSAKKNSVLKSTTEANSYAGRARHGMEKRVFGPALNCYTLSIKPHTCGNGNVRISKIPSLHSPILCSRECISAHTENVNIADIRLTTHPVEIALSTQLRWDLNIFVAYVKRYTLPVICRLARLLSLQVKLATMVPCSQLPQFCSRARNKRVAIILHCKYHVAVLSRNYPSWANSLVLGHFFPYNGEDAFPGPRLDNIESKMENYWHLAIDYHFSSCIPLLSSNKHNSKITPKLGHCQGAYQRYPKVS